MAPMKAFKRVHCMVVHFDILMVSALGPTCVLYDIGNVGMLEGSALIVPL